ncbi:MAG: DUF420 domain-containing protein [Candidatus Acidiferrales bacterium]
MASASLSFFPALDACLNGTSAILAATGYLMIRRGKVLPHKVCMISAVICSATFLFCYVYFHLHAGIVRFTGQGVIRPVYFTILTTHTILAIVIVPLVLITLTFALRAQFRRHKKIARWTLPLWLYVSVTGVIVYYLLFVLYTPYSWKQSLGDELVRLEGQYGLTVASFYRGIDIVSFKNRTVIHGKEPRELGLQGTLSRDGLEIAAGFPDQAGDHLGIATWDGTDIRRYPDIPAPADACWSFDKSMLVVSVQKFDFGAAPPNSKLEILGLTPEETQEIDVRAHVTTQCWSPDDKEIVYDAADSVRTYDTTRRIWRVIAKGTEPTWSPDGKWIAFLDDGTYWVIQPSGEVRKILFRKRNAASGLYWSPDSRIVAYTRRVGLLDLLDGVLPLLDADAYRLWVRRLEDNSEESVGGNWGVGGFQWIENKQLVQSLESTAASK